MLSRQFSKYTCRPASEFMLTLQPARLPLAAFYHLATTAVGEWLSNSACRFAVGLDRLTTVGPGSLGFMIPSNRDKPRLVFIAAKLSGILGEVITSEIGLFVLQGLAPTGSRMALRR